MRWLKYSRDHPRGEEKPDLKQCKGDTGREAEALHTPPQFGPILEHSRRTRPAAGRGKPSLHAHRVLAVAAATADAGEGMGTWGSSFPGRLVHSHPDRGADILEDRGHALLFEPSAAEEVVARRSIS